MALTANGGIMRLTLQGAIFATALLMLSIGVPLAGAVSGPDANENSKFVYTEEIIATDLVLNFDEGGQKRFPSVVYRLDATVEVIRFCGGQGIGTRETVDPTVTVTPNEQGRAVGAFTVDAGTSVTPCSCCSQGTLTVDYSNMTLTNLASGHAYRLDPVSQTYTT
jgi:hypothetical protein